MNEGRTACGPFFLLGVSRFARRRLRPSLVDTDRAGVLADKLMAQARANHDKLVRV